MEGRPPPDDELFEWTDSPARPPRREREPEGGGERSARSSPAARSDTEERRRVRRGDTGERRRAQRGDTGEFERSGRRPPPGRRSRRRDLPARVRRRQDLIIGGLALIVVVGLIVLISGGGGSSEKTIGLKRLVGQTIVAKLGAKGPDQALIQRVKQGRVGGVIAFNSDASKLKADVAHAPGGGERRRQPATARDGRSGGRRREAAPAGPPERLAGTARQERRRGPVQGPGESDRLLPAGPRRQRRPRAGPRCRPAEHRRHDQEPHLRNRSRPWSPRSASPSPRDCRTAGSVATAKHFPGLGRATVSTDDRPTDIAATSDQLQSDLEPFKGAIAAGVKMVMVSTAELSDARARRSRPHSRPPIVSGPAARPARLRRSGHHRRPRVPRGYRHDLASGGRLERDAGGRRPAALRHEHGRLRPGVQLPGPGGEERAT